MTCEVVAGLPGFLLIINGFVKFPEVDVGGISMTTNASVSGTEVEQPEFKPLTAAEAAQLRERNPELSPWWVIGAQVAAGAVVAGVAWIWVGQLVAAVSAFYGAMAVAVPAALFARGVRVRPGGASQAAMLRFFVWESIKIVLTVALLAAAPRWIDGLVWLALVAGVVTAMKMYWVALLVRPGLLNRN